MDDLNLSLDDLNLDPAIPGQPSKEEPARDILGRPMYQKRRISQSLIKAMRFDPTTGDAEACPARIKAQYIDGLRDRPSESMMHGLYFESMTLGSTRGGDTVEDLPRTEKTNKKTAVHERLDMQIIKFKQEIVPAFRLVISKDNTQLEYVRALEHEKYELVLHPDLISPILDPTLDAAKELPMAVIDVKTTDNIFSNYGDFSWGMPHLMDHTQAITYAHSMAEADPDYAKWFQENYPDQGVFPFYYIVVETGTQMRYKLIRKRVMHADVAEMKQTIRRTMATLESWGVLGWETKPNWKDCEGCPLASTCPKYRIGRDIQVI